MRKFNLAMSQFDNLKMKRLFFFYFLFLIFHSFGFAQQNTMHDAPQMADSFRAEGKIYVVVLVLSVVFACLAAYLIIIDRKISKLERRIIETKLNDKISNVK